MSTVFTKLRLIIYDWNGDANESLKTQSCVVVSNDQKSCYVDNVIKIPRCLLDQLFVM